MKLFVGLVLLPALSMSSLLMVILDHRPAVATVTVPKPDDAVRARLLARQLYRRLFQPEHGNLLVAKRADVASVLAFVSRSLPGTRYAVEIDRYRAMGAVAIELPDTPFGRYLNIRAGVLPSDDGLALAPVAIGGLSVPGDLVVWLARLVLDLASGEDSGTKLVASIRSVELDTDTMTVAFSPYGDLRQGFRNARGVLRTTFTDLVGADQVRLYYGALDRLAASAPPTASLADYVAPLMALAGRRTDDGSSAVHQNQAVILALASYFGDATAFERLIGKFRTGGLAELPRRGGTATLGGRHDLMLHFVVSAAIKVVADSGIALTVGEFKELLDSASGGSGFSFADLAADRAGVRFAELASTPASARRFQTRFAAPRREADYFPTVAGLPEGLSEAQFANRYGTVDDPRYRTTVAEIDQRIDSLALFQ